MIARMAYPPSGGMPPQSWGPQPYSAPYTPRGTNAMAIAALVSSLLLAPLGIVFGHIALSQIRRTGEDGHGMAVAGLVIGYVFTIFFVLFIVFWVIFFAAIVNEIDDLPSTTTTYDYYSSHALPTA